MTDTNLPEPPKTGLISDIRAIVAALSLPYRAGLVAIAFINLSVVLLDSLGLALLMPLVSLITLSEISSGANNIILEWGERLFSLLGQEFTVLWIVVVITVTQIIRACGIFVHSWISALLKARFEVELQQRLFFSFLGARWEHQAQAQLGKVMNTMSTETRRSGGAYNSLTVVISAAVSLVIYFLISVSVSWQLSLTAVIGTVVIASILHVFTKYSRKLGALRSVVTAKFYSELAELLAGIKFIKTSALEEKSFGQVVTSSQRVGQVDSKMGIAQGALQSMSELLFVFFLIMGLLVGTKIFVVPTSEVALFTLLFFRIFQQSKKMQVGVQGFSQDIPGFNVVHAMRQEAESKAESVGKIGFSKLHNEIRFRDVCFEYNDGTVALRNVNIDIPQGSVVSIVGPSGAGKSTIIDLIAGLINPTSGEVSIDGANLGTFNQFSWRQQVSYLTQEPFLFNDTVENNIAWASREHNIDQVVEAAKLAGAHNFIVNLSDGYKTNIGDRGTLISGGQRQRLCLARAFIRSPQLLILDEATSELDSQSETIIKSAIEQIAGKVTILIVAHRSSIVMNSDISYVIENGSIVEHGSPADLMAANGPFNNMSNE